LSDDEFLASLSAAMQSGNTGDAATRLVSKRNVLVLKRTLGDGPARSNPATSTAHTDSHEPSNGEMSRHDYLVPSPASMLDA
jgi:hypothetical protein